MILVAILGLTLVALFLVLSSAGPFEFSLLSIKGGVPKGENTHMRGEIELQEGERKLTWEIKKSGNPDKLPSR